MTALRQWVLEERELFEEHHELMGLPAAGDRKRGNQLRAHEQALMRDFRDGAGRRSSAVDPGHGAGPTWNRASPPPRAMAVFDLLGDDRKHRAEASCLGGGAAGKARPGPDLHCRRWRPCATGNRAEIKTAPGEGSRGGRYFREGWSRNRRDAAR